MPNVILPVRDVRVQSLASGSSGNAMLVQAGETNLLIDAGLSLSRLAPLLSRRGVSAANLDAILLTHEHTDHACGAGPLARRGGVPLVANAATLAAYAERDDLPFLSRDLPTGDTLGIGAIGVRSFSIPHDAADAVGYALEIGNLHLVYMTDTGSVSMKMREALRGASLAVVEANHDAEWLQRGPYSDEMKARIASPVGHLSNHECARMLAERLEADGPLCIWLAHLSRVNNSVALARRSVTEAIRQQTRTPFALEVALRDHPSVVWQSGAQAIQLSLL
jgi:phosphoribosyl 1,2-cyclic phosphodiesterase